MDTLETKRTLTDALKIDILVDESMACERIESSNSNQTVDTNTSYWKKHLFPDDRTVHLSNLLQECAVCV